MDYIDTKNTRIIIQFSWILINYLWNFVDTDYKMTI